MAWAPTSHGSDLPQRASEVLQLPTPNRYSRHPVWELCLLPDPTPSRLSKWVNTNQPCRSSGDGNQDRSPRPRYLSPLWHETKVPQMTTKERERENGREGGSEPLASGMGRTQSHTTQSRVHGRFQAHPAAQRSRVRRALESLGVKSLYYLLSQEGGGGTMGLCAFL